MNCLKTHGLIKTVATIGVLCLLLASVGIAWRLPEIITAIKL